MRKSTLMVRVEQLFLPLAASESRPPVAAQGTTTIVRFSRTSGAFAC